MKKVLFTVVIFFFLVLMMGEALAVPPLPHTFWGTARKDGVIVPDGTTISAWINGVQYKSATTPGIDAPGTGSYTFNVPGDDPDTSSSKEGGVNGETISFQVGTEWASQTSTFASGSTTQLNLTVSTQYALTININPANAGYVLKNPNKSTYNSGENVTLTATPYSGYTFSSWSGDASGSNLSTSITMDGNKTVTANFTALPPASQYTLTVSSTPFNGGTVSVVPNQTSFNPGDQVTLNATANSGYSFGYWGGDASGSQNPVVITMDKDKYIVANFSATLGETISTPSAPNGPTTGNTGGSYSFSASGASSSKGHSIQYFFDWGDGTQSGWLPVGTSSASHAWSESRTYLVQVQARCSIDTLVVSNWSQTSSIRIDLASLPLIGVLEYPSEGQRVSGFTTIDGWALDAKGIKKVELYVDDEFEGNIAYGSTLKDVKTAHPEYPDAENSGFCMVWNASALSPGSHKVKVRLNNLDGQTKDLEVSVNVINFQEGFVESVSPASRVLRTNKVTVDGVTKKYDIKIEWSNELQGFVISEITRR